MKRSTRYPAQPRDCHWCGRTFTPPDKGKKAIYCGRKCRAHNKEVLALTEDPNDYTGMGWVGRDGLP